MAGYVTGASISPNSCHVALATEDIDRVVPAHYLYIYEGSTGEQLMRHTVSGDTPFFAPGGCDLWLVDHDGVMGRCLESTAGGRCCRTQSAELISSTHQKVTPGRRLAVTGLRMVGG